MWGGIGDADPIPGCRIYLSIVFGEITLDFVRFCPSVKRDIISDILFFLPFLFFFFKSYTFFLVIAFASD